VVLETVTSSRFTSNFRREDNRNNDTVNSDNFTENNTDKILSLNSWNSDSTTKNRNTTNVDTPIKLFLIIIIFLIILIIIIIIILNGFFDFSNLLILFRSIFFFIKYNKSKIYSYQAAPTTLIPTASEAPNKAHMNGEVFNKNLPKLNCSPFPVKRRFKATTTKKIAVK